MGVSPFRRSRISYLSDVQDGCRCPFRVLEIAESNPAPLERVLPAMCNYWLSGSTWASTTLPSLRPLQYGHLGSRNSAFTIPSGSRRACRLVVSLHLAFPNMLVSPLTFVARWVRWSKGITLNPSRVARGSTQAAMRRTAAERPSPSACDRLPKK